MPAKTAAAVKKPKLTEDEKRNGEFCVVAKKNRNKKPKEETKPEDYVPRQRYYSDCAYDMEYDDYVDLNRQKQEAQEVKELDETVQWENDIRQRHGDDYFVRNDAIKLDNIEIMMETIFSDRIGGDMTDKFTLSGKVYDIYGAGMAKNMTRGVPLERISETYHRSHKTLTDYCVSQLEYLRICKSPAVTSFCLI